MKSKELVGHHLMRVRIRKSIFEKLQEVAAEETERTGEDVTVSDLVRQACQNYLMIHQGLRLLESTPPSDIGGEVLVLVGPIV